MMRGSPLQCVLGYEIHARPSCRPVIEVNITSFGDWRRSSIALLVRQTARFAKALVAIWKLVWALSRRVDFHSAEREISV
jgi:hypothetical protein